MAHDYSENILVQESAGNQLHDELGWEVIFAYNTEKLGKDGTLGRKSYHEVLLTRYLDAAIRKFNTWMSDAQVADAIATFSSYLSSSSLMQINEEKYGMIRDGIPISVHNQQTGETEDRRVRVIDFANPENNHFLAVKEMKIHGDLHRRRTDIVGFVNGIPLLFVELKGTNVDVKNAYTDNYTDYLDTIPQLFHYNAMIMLSNGLEAKVGTLGSKWEFFHEWKRLKEEDEGDVALETMLRGICKKENFIDLIENFILYDHSEGRTVKILSRNHQYLGVNEAVKAYADRKLRDGKLGVFWHTQGSGKSYSMLFLSQKIKRKFEGSPTIIILTDREELNNQITETFLYCGLLGKDGEAKNFIAPSGEELVKMIKRNPGYVFTLIQKFNRPNETPFIPDFDIIIMSDEAHRSQYGIYADNMMHLLPTASRIGFTGTPIMKYDNITERTFGGYVSIYDFKRAVDDHATVPLFYENRAEKLKQIKNPEINEKIAEAIEKAELDPNQQEKLEREFAKEIHLLTAQSRLDTIAKDFVHHYSDLWQSGKAMFVCLNKVTCVRMYNLAQKYWQEEIIALQEKIKHCNSEQEAQELNRKLKWMQETEMCVVVSQEQNEIQTFAKWGLDIKFHREKMERRELDKEFRDAKNPFRIVFVCAMWLTGFDVKSLSCLYFDKPLKAHTLMQAIARANRVAEGKSNGLIIDYIGIVKALREALAKYTVTGTGGGGGDPQPPTIDKEKLITRALEIIARAKDYLQQRNFSLNELIAATDFKKMALLKEAANILCETLEIKKTFQAYASELAKIFKFINTNDVDESIRKYKEAILAIDGQLQAKRKSADNTALMVEINRIVNEYVSTESTGGGTTKFDISKIDFDLLQREFAKSKTKALVLRDIQEIVKQRIEAMLERNPTRINYYERYQEIIKAYNREQDRATIEKTFMELIKLSEVLTEEEKRYVREGFADDEQLSMFDLLYNENLSKDDIKKLKEVAVDLLDKIKSKISKLHNWTDKEETRSIVSILIRDTLWNELPESFSDESIADYRKKVYEYVYTHYKVVA